MKRAFLVITAVVLVTISSAACRSAAPVETQREFGARMARMNLWREAMFRFRRAVELEPTNAEARSNLAVSLEANGDFEGAAREYREAMRLDKSNQYIQKNYSRFVEFTSRNKKREAREPRRQEAAPVNGTPSDPAKPPTAGETPADPTPDVPADRPEPTSPPSDPPPVPKPTATAPSSVPGTPPSPPPPASPPSPQPFLGGSR